MILADPWDMSDIELTLDMADFDLPRKIGEMSERALKTLSVLLMLVLEFLLEVMLGSL